MVTLTTFLTPDTIRQGVFISSKKRALELIGAIVAEQLNIHSNNEQDEICPIACFANLFKREKLGSTAINNGVALPHSKLPVNATLQLTQPIAVFLQLATPIEYDANDNKDVDLIYAVLFPEQSCDQYKNALQIFAQQLSDKNLLKQLRMAQSVEEIWQILCVANQQIGENESGE